jgi:hypothetical protein
MHSVLSLKTGCDTTSASLHLQAVAILNIRSLIPVTLDLANNNYSKWRRLFLTILKKYTLTGHVLSEEPHLDRASWDSMESTVLT